MAMGVIAVLCATKGDRRPQGLEHVPEPRIYLESTITGWAAASNALLDEAAVRGCDALFLDDDVTLTPRTFADMEKWLSPDTLVGFQCRDSGRVISAGHFVTEGGILLPNPRPHTAAYMAHVTASAMYIPHAILASGVRFPHWPGLHSEDVAYTYAVWMAGFKVLYWPSPVLHHVASNGIGATKAHENDMGRRLLENLRCLGEWINESGALSRVPMGITMWEAQQNGHQSQ